MPNIIATNFSTLLLQIKSDLIDSELFNSTTVWIGNKFAKTKLPASTSYAIIHYGEMSNVDKQITVVEGPLYITVRLYSSLDQDIRADIRNTTISDVVQTIVDLFSLQMVFDGTNYLTTEPLILRSYGMPLEVERDNDYWVEQTLTFNCKWFPGSSQGGGGDFSSSDFSCDDYACV